MLFRSPPSPTQPGPLRGSQRRGPVLNCSQVKLSHERRVPELLGGLSATLIGHGGRGSGQAAQGHLVASRWLAHLGRRWEAHLGRREAHLGRREARLGRRREARLGCRWEARLGRPAWGGPPVLSQEARLLLSLLASPRGEGTSRHSRASWRSPLRPVVRKREAFSPLQYFCLEKPMDGGAWWAAVHGVAKSRTRLSDFTFTFHFHALEKEMATHSSVLAWRIPGTGEPGGLPSMESHRVGHD